MLAVCDEIKYLVILLYLPLLLEHSINQTLFAKHFSNKKCSKKYFTFDKNKTNQLKSSRLTTHFLFL